MSTPSSTSSGTASSTARPAAAQRRPARAGSAQRRAPWLLLAPFLVLFLLTFVVPIVYAVGQSFTSVQRLGLFGEDGITTSFAGFDNYARALGDPAFTASIARVLLFGVVQVPVMIVAVTVLALLLESASAKWPSFFRAAYFLPYGIPGVIASILWSFLYLPGFSPVVAGLQALGLDVDFLNAQTVLWSIANIVTWSYAGYNMLIVIAQLKAIPAEVYEAAKVDGAGPLRLAWSVQLPLIRPALVLTTVFSIIGTLQLFAEPQVIRNVSPAVDVKYTPNFAAYSSAFSYNDYGVAAAQAVVIALAAFVLSFAFLRLVSRRDS